MFINRNRKKRSDEEHIVPLSEKLREEEEEQRKQNKEKKEKENYVSLCVRHVCLEPF